MDDASTQLEFDSFATIHYFWRQIETPPNKLGFFGSIPEEP